MNLAKLPVLAARWDRIVKVNVDVIAKVRAHLESNPASEISVSETSRPKASSKSAVTGFGKQRSMNSLTPKVGAARKRS